MRPASRPRPSPTRSRRSSHTRGQRLNIANDDFIRTTEPRHKAAVTELLQRCYDAGDIELDTYSGKYCVGCELYYSEDELVEVDGVDDCCPIHKRPVETLEEENYFFRLSRFQDRLLDWYASHPGAMKPDNRANEAIGLIKGGLRDFSISRTSLEWGIPLPWDSTHVTYVWFDALTNYLAAVGFGDEQQDYTDWWPVDYHLIGKDIVRQHCVYWPAMLMSAGVELPKGWAIGGWLLVDGEKMAKSGGNVVNPLDLIDTVGVDGFRYYVLAETPYGSDGDFSYEGLVGKYNSDLANNLGNLAARVATVVAKKCDGIGPAPRADSPLAAAAAAAYEGAVQGWDDVAPSKALDATWSLVRATNAYLEANEPWKAEPGPEVDAVMGDALEALRIVSVLAFPAVPETAQASGSGSASTSDISEQRLPQAAALGCVSGRGDRHQGRPAVPPHRAVNLFDSHCHVHDERMPGGVDGAVDGARRRRRHHDGHRRVRPGHVARGDRRGRTAPRRVGDRRPAPARSDPHRRHDRRPLRATRRSSPSARPVSTTTTTTHRGRSRPRHSPRRSASPHDLDLPLVIHTRDAWADTFDILDAEGTPDRHDLPLLHRRSRRGPVVPRSWRLRQLLGDRHVQERHRRPGRRPDRAAATGC